MNNLIINTERDRLLLYFKALEFAAYKHRYQKRKGTRGIPYINHPIEVSHLILNTLKDPSPELLIAALLHDTLEDTETTAGEIEALFGSAVLSIVLEVTDDMKLSSRRRKQLQVEHASQLSSDARAIKIADKTCNIRDIVLTRIQWPRIRKIDYIRWAIQVIQPISTSHPPLEEEFRKVIRLAEEKLKTKFFPTIA